MNTIQASYANHLGKKICYKFREEAQKELILLSVSLSNITVLNSNTDMPVTAAYDECLLIFNSTEELKEAKAPDKFSLVRVNSKLVPASELVKKSWVLIKKDLEIIGCKCSNISPAEFQNNMKTRKKEYVWIRQVVCSVLHKLENLSAAKAGMLYGKDHATVLSSVKTVKNLSETDKLWVFQYREMLEYIINQYGNKAEQIICVTKINSI